MVQDTFDKVWIKTLYEDRFKGESTVLIKLEPGAHLPFHKHPELEQAYVLEGSMYDHDGVVPRRRVCVAQGRVFPREPFRHGRRHPGGLPQAEHIREWNRLPDRQDHRVTEASFAISLQTLLSRC
jgi:hypothetical protein